MLFRIITLLLIAASQPLSAAAPAAAAAKNFEWETVPAVLAGLDSTRLARMVDDNRQHGTKALLVVRKDKIALEWYAQGHGPDKQHYTASLAKALVGGMSLLVALSDGKVLPDDPVCNYIPYWKNDPLRSKITVRQLATHSSGIEDAETPGVGHFEQTGWKYRFWQQDPDPFSMAARQAPVIYEPGSRYQYSNPGIGLLSYVITAREGIDVRTLLQERIMDPIGAPRESYSLGYGKTFEVDGLKLVPNWGGGGYTARTIARVGRLLLRKGNWEGKQLVDSTWAHRVVQYAGTPLPSRPDGEPNPAPALGFYSNFDGVWENVPRDAFAGAGAGNQVLLVIPSLEMIIVRNGSLLDTGEKSSFWGGIEKHLLDPVMEAVIQPPLPASTLIDSISFEPVEGIEIGAVDCDNWPITWADDDAMYTAYGDGWGFRHEIEKKLSNGLARIDGGPEDWTGVNIRTETGETVGQGPDGSKASGMLSVDGVLYMWMRNSANSQLAWSKDHGKTWEWGFKFTANESMGCPTLLNFGRDYAGARDDYVYTYSQDGPSAYEDYDRVVLARVPKSRITERGAYEFFAGYDDAGNPTWSADISERAATLSFPGHCHRIDVTYNPGIDRYLMAMASNHRGAWGIYEAKEPWGPWRTAFFTPYWGLGDTHGYRIPSKWISEDGRSFYLVFSGRVFGETSYDAFCVRKATIHLVGE